MNQRLLALYGLKWNPFTPDVPIEALYVPPQVENFCWRIEQAHLREGGFALVHGDPGSGKSVVMRLLAERLGRLTDLSVGVIHHPQSHLSDFYRELGDLFGLAVSTSNRWGAYKTVRAKWQEHIQQTLFRPVLLVDEAQEMSHGGLAELRLLGPDRGPGPVRPRGPGPPRPARGPGRPPGRPRTGRSPACSPPPARGSPPPARTSRTG